MPRLKVIEPAQASDKAKAIFDGPLRARKLNIFKGIANNPNVLEGFLGFLGGVTKDAALSPAEQELVALVSAGVNHCEYCAAAHSKAASAHGLSDHAIERALNGSADDAKHKAIVDFAKQVIDTTGFVSDEQLDAFRDAGFGDEAVVEIIGLIAVNYFTNLFNHVNDTEIDAVFRPAGVR